MLAILSSFGAGSKRSTRDIIIQILSDHWPLSAKQVFAAVKNQSKQDISYQAVHKALQQMVSEGVLAAGKNGYQINADWINRLKRMSQDLDSKYSPSEKTKIAEETAVSFTFNNFSQMGRFVIYKLLNGELNPENKPSLCLWQHTWPTIGLSDEDYRAIQGALKNTVHYCIVEGDSFLDKWFADSLQKLGKKCKTSVECPGNPDLVVEGDYVAQVFFPLDFRKNFNAQYEKIKTANEVDIFNVFSEILGKEAKITLTITKNLVLADQLREETLRLFEDGKK